MEDLDMSGVDPLRRAEVRRRVGVIRAFISIPKPSDTDRKKHAALLGLRAGQFQSLVRAWKEHGRASAISGSGSTRGAKRETGPRHLAAEVKQAARDVIASLESHLTLAQTVEAVNNSLTARGLKPPSRSTIWNMVMDARRNSVGGTSADVVLVSRCWIKLPIASADGTISYPELILAVSPFTGVILAASMSCTNDTAARIAAVVMDEPGDPDIRVENALAAPFELAGVDVTRLLSHNGRKELARVLGRGFDTISIIYQPARAVDPAEALRSTKDQPLTPKDARDVVADLLLRHNAARQAPAATWVD